MNDDLELPRLRRGGDSVFAELRAGIELAAQDGPDPAQSARMRAALGLPATSAGDAAASPATASAHAVGHLLRMALAIAGIAAATLGAAYWVIAVAMPAQVAVTATSGARTHVPDARSAGPASAAQLTRIRALAQGRAHAAGADGLSSDAVAVPTQPPAESVRAPLRTPPDLQPGTSARTNPRIAAGDELALLKRARAHVRSAPEAALGLVAQHEATFASGAFVQEREVIAIEALLAAARVRDAEQRAADFFERFPESAHARRIRMLFKPRRADDWPVEPPASAHPSH